MFSTLIIFYIKVSILKIALAALPMLVSVVVGVVSLSNTKQLKSSILVKIQGK